jgi:isopentenyl phosphate kinase
MIFLKLGGSLITDKSRREHAHHALIERLAFEIAEALDAKPDLTLLLGHGSGSFGHQAAAKYNTHMGAETAQDWRGFAQVWAAAQRLHHIVLRALWKARLPAVGFSPSASAVCSAGKLSELATTPLENALSAGLLPVVHGDVAFDRVQGACILSTESIFSYLAPILKPQRVLLAGLDAGVLNYLSEVAEPLAQLRADDLKEAEVQGAPSPDVTGGMAGKVRVAFDLLAEHPDVELRIFTGSPAGSVRDTLLGAAPGTLLLPDPP